MSKPTLFNKECLKRNQLMNIAIIKINFQDNNKLKSTNMPSLK